MPTKIVTADILNEQGETVLAGVSATVRWGLGGFRSNGRWEVEFELAEPHTFTWFSHWIAAEEFWGESFGSSWRAS